MGAPNYSAGMATETDNNNNTDESNVTDWKEHNGSAAAGIANESPRVSDVVQAPAETSADHEDHVDAVAVAPSTSETVTATLSAPLPLGWD